MQDETASIPTAPVTPPRKRSARGILLLALLAFVLGAAGAVWLASRGYLEDLGLVVTRNAAATTSQAAAASATVEPDQAANAVPGNEAALGSAEARIAMLEDRLSRLDQQTDSASGNAARAESLLIAFAARRTIDRGEPLRYLADQLQLRFANAQPKAVRTIVDFARNPVTIDELSSRLEALSPQLTLSSPDDSFIDRAMNDLANLFTIHREPSEVIGPEAGVERARIMLGAGRIDEAVTQVRRLPGAEEASKWVSDAQRYSEVQRALDLIETSAMLESSRLQDGSGNPVRQPSPLAAPTARPSAAPEDFRSSKIWN